MFCQNNFLTSCRILTISDYDYYREGRDCEEIDTLVLQ